MNNVTVMEKTQVEVTLTRWRDLRVLRTRVATPVVFPLLADSIMLATHTWRGQTKGTATMAPYVIVKVSIFELHQLPVTLVCACYRLLLCTI